MSTLENKTILITGTNRGIGKALLEEVLTHNPAKVYATARDISTIDTDNERVEKLTLDITDEQSVSALSSIDKIDVLINNAGVLTLDTPESGNDLNMEVNYFGTISTTQTLLPKIKTGGNITTISSILAFAPMSQAVAYSSSKAAIHTYILTLRDQLKDRNISVSGVYPGAIDTDMTKGMEVQKADVSETARQILQGIIDGQEYIFPDSGSHAVAGSYTETLQTLETSLMQ